MRYCPSYFQGYRILCSIFCLLSGILILREINHGDICQFIRDTCLFSRDMGYLVPPPPPIQASNKEGESRVYSDRQLNSDSDLVCFVFQILE